MSYEYIDASRESMDHALPDVEIFNSDAVEGECDRGCGLYNIPQNTIDAVGDAGIPCPSECGGIMEFSASGNIERAFWYQFGMPGYMPDSEPSGPYDTAEDALTAAREAAGYCAHGVAGNLICKRCGDG
jgi:hypothetical protein